MKKFIVLYHAPDELLAQSADTNPEEMEKGMEAIWSGMEPVKLKFMKPLHYRDNKVNLKRLVYIYNK